MVGVRVGGWMGGKAVLRTADRSQKETLPSSSEVISSCQAFFGNFVLRLWTLLLKLSMAR